MDFLPRNVDAGLLVLGLWLGVSLLVLHGWSKLSSFSEMAGKVPNPLGVDSSVRLTLAIFAEVACAALIAVGLFTRSAAIVQVILMSVAFFIVKKTSLAIRRDSGELAFIYLAGLVTLFQTGAGRLSLDAKMGGKNRQNEN